MAKRELICSLLYLFSLHYFLVQEGEFLDLFHFEVVVYWAGGFVPSLLLLLGQPLVVVHRLVCLLFRAHILSPFSAYLIVSLATPIVVFLFQVPAFLVRAGLSVVLVPLF